jgi:hypothetical protein
VKRASTPPESTSLAKPVVDASRSRQHGEPLRFHHIDRVMIGLRSAREQFRTANSHDRGVTMMVQGAPEQSCYGWQLLTLISMKESTLFK